MQVQHTESRLPCDPISDRRRAASGVRGGKWTTGHAGVGNQASYGNYVSGIKLRKIQKIGTWNVRGLLSPGKLTELLENEISRCELNICGLSETHWKGSGHKNTDNSIIYFSGNDTTSRNGVAVILPKQQRHCVLGYEPVSDRIISVKIKASPVNLNLVQVYAPTSAATDDAIEDFYSELENTTSRIPNRELLIVMGDFNAKIGANSSRLSQCVGNYGLGKCNERGERFMQFAAENSLIVTNSLFQHHPRRLYTWISPDGKYRNQIDYVLVRSRWKTSIQNVHTLPGADCGSDHQLLITKLKIKLNAARTTEKVKKLIVYDTAKFTSAVEQNWSEWSNANLEGETSDTMWDKAKRIIKTAAIESKPPTDTRKRQHWMTGDTFTWLKKDDP